MLLVLDIQTELLILAHLCYSGVCNMEGISNVLRAARVMTVWMEKEREFSNMVSIHIIMTTLYLHTPHSHIKHTDEKEYMYHFFYVYEDINMGWSHDQIP